MLYQAKVTADYLNIRATPSANGAYVGYLKKGDVVSVYLNTNGWSAITSDFNQWVSSKYLVSLPPEIIIPPPVEPPVEPPVDPPITIDPTYELWLDIYQGNGDHDFKVLRDNGVTGICGKIGYGYYNSRGANGSQKDSRFLSNGELALKAGLKYAGYWWQHPYEEIQRQVNTAMGQCANLDIEFIANDVEQHNGFAPVWNKARRRFLPQNVKAFDSKKISDVALAINERLDSYKKYPILTYTRNTFMYEYSPQMLTWMPRYDYWVVQTPYERVITCEKWEAEAFGFIYCPDWETYLRVYAIKPDGSYPINLPYGIKYWKIWQFSIDHVKLPGSDSFMDLNWVRK